MTQIRYKNDLHRPGDGSPGKPDIVRYDASVKSEWDNLQARRQELRAHLAEFKREQEQIEINLAAMAAEGFDYKDELGQLAQVRLEQEVHRLALNYLDDKAERLKRANSWL